MSPGLLSESGDHHAGSADDEQKWKPERIQCRTSVVLQDGNIRLRGVDMARRCFSNGIHGDNAHGLALVRGFSSPASDEETFVALAINTVAVADMGIIRDRRVRRVAHREHLGRYDETWHRRPVSCFFGQLVAVPEQECEDTAYDDERAAEHHFEPERSAG